MKILILMPPYLGIQQNDGYRWPLLGALYLAANLEANGHMVTVEDLFFIEKGIPHYKFFYYGKTREYVENMFTQGDYDLLAITCPFTSRWPFVTDLINMSKRLKPHVPIITGGIYPSTFPKECLEECPNLDFVLVGESDRTIVDFCKALKGEIPFSSVEGLAYKNNGSIQLVPKVNYINNLDDLPYPAYHLVPIKKYFGVMKSLDLKGVLFPILTSRSCPNQCPFCNMYISHGKRWRARSARNVVDEMKYLKTKYHAKLFAFIDDNVTLSKNRIVEMCKLIIEEELNIEWNCPNGVSIKTLDKPTLSMMKEAGCTFLVLPIESADDHMRNEIMKKKLSIEKIEEIIYACKELGISTTAGFIIGYPGDSDVTINNTLKFLKKYPIDSVGVNILWPYKGTAVYDLCIEKGYLEPCDQNNFFNIDTVNPIVETEDFDKSKVLAWKSLLLSEFRNKHGRTNTFIKKLISRKYRVKFGLDANLFDFLLHLVMKRFSFVDKGEFIEQPDTKYPSGYNLEEPNPVD